MRTGESDIYKQNCTFERTASERMKPKAENKIVAPIELSDVAPDIEQKHVKEVYDVIAGHFSATRKKNHVCF